MNQARHEDDQASTSERHLLQQLQEDLHKIVKRVVRTPEIQDKLEYERLDGEQLAAEVSVNTEVILRARADYEPVLDQHKRLKAYREQEPPAWEAGWRPRWSQVAALIAAAALPYAWLLLTMRYFGYLPRFAQIMLALTFPLVLLSIRTLARFGLPRTFWAWLRWSYHYLLLHFPTWEKRREWQQLTRESIVLPEVREWINARSEPSFDHQLKIRDASGLATPSELNPVVRTASIEKLIRELDRPTGGAVAVAGRRGVGKTTLIERVVNRELTTPQMHRPLTVLVSAPTRYDSRDFLLHLHASVCREVIDYIAPPGRDRTADHQEADWRRFIRLEYLKTQVVSTVRSLAKSFLAIVGGLLCAIWAWADHGSQPVHTIPSELSGFVFALLSQPLELLTPPFQWNTLPKLAATVLFVGGWVALLLRVLPSAVVSVSALLIRSLHSLGQTRVNVELAALRKLAEQQLRRIRYLQTHTGGWSGKIVTPGGISFGPTRSVQHTEQPLTHPEVVNEFRQFVERTADVLRRNVVGAARLVIAIDELDKMTLPEQAHEFVNEIKSAFSARRCLFLVSVSEDAIAAFERRGLPVRDAFDSAFNTMINIEPFTLIESRQWLCRRAIGIPEPFICLCHCLSGGLPRELSRVSVAMHDLLDSDSEPVPKLDQVTGTLIRDELAAKIQAFSFSASQLDNEDVSSFLATLERVTPNARTSDLLRLTRELLPAVTLDTETMLPRLHTDLGCYIYFCATLLEVFGAEPTRSDFEVLCDGDSPGANLHTLTRARQHMALDPQLSWGLLNSFRADWQLERIQGWEATHPTA